MAPQAKKYHSNENDLPEQLTTGNTSKELYYNAALTNAMLRLVTRKLAFLIRYCKKEAVLNILDNTNTGPSVGLQLQKDIRLFGLITPTK